MLATSPDVKTNKPYKDWKFE